MNRRPDLSKNAQTDINDLERISAAAETQWKARSQLKRDRFPLDVYDVVPARAKVCDGGGGADHPVLGVRVGRGEDHIWQTRCLLEQLQSQVSFSRSWALNVCVFEPWLSSCLFSK